MSGHEFAFFGAGAAVGLAIHIVCSRLDHNAWCSIVEKQNGIIRFLVDLNVDDDDEDEEVKQ